MAQTANDVPTREQAVERALQFYQRGLVRQAGVSASSARAATARGTERWLTVQAWAQGLEVVFANAIALEDAALPDTATGDDLDRICAIYGLSRSGGAGAQGPVTVTCSGSVTYPEGRELTSNTTGKRYRVVASTVAVDGDSVDIVGIDVGTASNLAAGEVLTWTSPPTGSGSTCVVASGGLVDGKDADNDSRLRERLLKLLREPQNGGSWAHYRQWAEDASASVEAAYVYPAAQGPGTVHLAYTVQGTADNAYARTGTTALTTLVAQAVTAEQPEYADVTVTTVVHQDVGLAFKVSLPEPLTGGGPGGGWLDPSTDRWAIAKIGAGNADGTVKVTVASSSLTFTVNAYNEPVDDSWIYLFSVTDRKPYLAQVASHSGSAGAWVVTLDRSLPTVAVGDYVWPACEQGEAYCATVQAEVAKLAPGEKTTDASVLPRAYRHPSATDGSPSDLTTTQLVAVQVAHREVTNAAYFEADESTVTLPLAPDAPTAVTDPPYVFRVSTLAFYPT